MSPTTKKHNKITRFLFYPIRTIIRLISKKTYVKLEYRYVTGHKLDLKNPKRYTAKLQYLRLNVYPNDPLIVEASSRVGAREYLTRIGLTNILIKCYGIFDRFEDINFDKLPNKFVMKCNHGCALNYLCFDKNKIDYNYLKKTFNKWLKLDYGKKTVEPHYSKHRHCIIIEEMLLENDYLPREYKIHCFNGKAKSLYVVSNRNRDIKYNNYLIDWTPFEESQFNHWTSSDEPLTPPKNYEEMVKIAEQIAAPFPFVRVDLYNINGKIYFSENTFTPAKGTLTLKDDKADFIMGEWLDISSYLNSKKN